MRICITGYTGFLGQRLTRLLDCISGLDWVGASLSNGFDLTKVDCLDRIGCCDVIINLAGRVGVAGSTENPAEYFQTNLLSTLSVMEYARRNGAQVIHLSSYLYGNAEIQPISEKHPLFADNPYAASKLQSEYLCMHYSNFFSIPTVILRPFNLFGPGQSENFLIPLVILQALEGGPVNVHALTPRRDYLWVDDLAEAICCVLRSKLEGFSIFNIGSGKSYSTSEVIDAVLSFTGPCKVTSNEIPRVKELSECICDNSLFSNAYDWAPRVDLFEGISRLISEFNKR